MLHIRVGEDLKATLTEEAKKIGLSLNAYVRMLLIERSKIE